MKPFQEECTSKLTSIVSAKVMGIWLLTTIAEPIHFSASLLMSLQKNFLRILWRVLFVPIDVLQTCISILILLSWDFQEQLQTINGLLGAGNARTWALDRADFKLSKEIWWFSFQIHSLGLNREAGLSYHICNHESFKHFLPIPVLLLRSILMIWSAFLPHKHWKRWPWRNIGELCIMIFPSVCGNFIERLASSMTNSYSSRNSNSRMLSSSISVTRLRSLPWINFLQ